MYCGFECSKYTLAILNVIYLMISFILIGVGTYAKVAAVITSIGVAAGIVACGVFLLILAIIGIVGAVKHHQVLLLLYMCLLALLFIIQFSISCACLAFNKKQQQDLVEISWRRANNQVKSYLQYEFNCCGLMTFNESGPMGHPPCAGLSCCGAALECCTSTNITCGCPSCWHKLEPHVGLAVRSVGGVGLFFSFIQMLGVALVFWTRRLYRKEQEKKEEVLNKPELPKQPGVLLSSGAPIPIEFIVSQTK